MASNDSFVDHIVDRVLAQLRSGGPIDGAPTAASERVGSAESETADTSQASATTISGKVVTAEVLEKRANGRSRITIDADAVLTPSARDFLRNNEIVCTRGTKQASGATKAAWTAIVVDRTSAVDQALEEAAASSGAGWRQLAAESAESAVESAIETVHEGEGVVLFCDRAATAACLANRDIRVRAAVADDASAVGRLKQELGPNVVCVGPSGKSYFELRNLLRAVSAVGTPEQPADWRESMGSSGGRRAN